MSRLDFKLEAKATHSRARAARLRTLHNDVLTPIFMPVGTRGTVRSQTNQHLESLGVQIVLANTYHLLIRPGMEAFQKLGGLHTFMNWKKSILTDSGGYQIFSLPRARSMGEAGAEFRSYLDGNKFLLTPELSIQMQKAIGSDIMMVLDQCIPSTSNLQEATAAMELTHRWAARSLEARGDSPQSLFAIVQGACFESLRRQSAQTLTQLNFDGFAIGGLAVGETKSQRENMTEFTTALLPESLPRYLMGVGTPIDLLEAVHRGVDMFDCILPTAWAQQGVVFTSQGKIDLKRGVYRHSDTRLDPQCNCEACTHYSRAYLHHLTKFKEVLGWQLLSTHNLKFYLDLMREMRTHILADTFYDFYRTRREALVQSDPDYPPIARKKNRRKIKPAVLGDYQIIESEGFASIGQISSGEVMHSVSQPDEEARRLYVDPVKIQELKTDVVVWDVGLGAAHNAMALIHALDKNPPSVRVHLVSFERDLNPLQLALQHIKKFEHLRHPAPHILLNRKHYQTKWLDWTLCEGNFLDQHLMAPPPDYVFYDPFSYKVDSDLWSLRTFSGLYDYFSKTTEMFTYTNSTAIRSTLLAAGFYIARGVATGPKLETTIAIKICGSRPVRDYLGKPWLDHRARSPAKFTQDIPPEFWPSLENKVLAHPQFL